MKNIILASLVALLAGCSLINTSTFDNNEYASFISIMTLAEQSKVFCDGPKDQMIDRAYRIDGHAHQLSNYTLHRVNNKSTHKIATIIKDTTSEMVDRYATGDKVSKIYCETKLDNIVDQAKMGADATQKKVRR
jgi:hypothetical protein